jgi:O-succinylbenzoate synthase
MVQGSLIRRLSDIARCHAWDGVAVTLFAVALVAGGGQVASGAEKLVEAVTPGIDAPQIMAAQARAWRGCPCLAFALRVIRPRCCFR